MEGIQSGVLNHWLAVPIISVAVITVLFKALTSAKRRRKSPNVDPPPPSPPPSNLNPPSHSSTKNDHQEIQPERESEKNKAKEKEPSALPTTEEKKDMEEKKKISEDETQIGADKGKESEDQPPATSVIRSGGGEEKIDNSGEIDSPIGKLTRPTLPESLKKSESFWVRLGSIGKNKTPIPADDGGSGEKHEDEIEEEDGGGGEHVDNRATSFIQRFKEELQLQRRQSIVRSREDKDKDKDKDE